MKGGNRIVSSLDAPLLLAPLTSLKNEFISAFDANGLQEMISRMKNDESSKSYYERTKELFGHLDEDANPIIIRYKMKSFN